jgi:hypothetical protein
MLGLGQSGPCIAQRRDDGKAHRRGGVLEVRPPRVRPEADAEYRAVRPEILGDGAREGASALEERRQPCLDAGRTVRGGDVFGGADAEKGAAVEPDGAAGILRRRALRDERQNQENDARDVAHAACHLRPRAALAETAGGAPSDAPPFVAKGLSQAQKMSARNPITTSRPTKKMKPVTPPRNLSMVQSFPRTASLALPKPSWTLPSA